MTFKVNDLVEWCECPNILGDFRYGRIKAVFPDGTMQLGFVKGIVHSKDCKPLEPGTVEYEKTEKFWGMYERY